MTSRTTHQPTPEPIVIRKTDGGFTVTLGIGNLAKNLEGIHTDLVTAEFAARFAWLEQESQALTDWHAEPDGGPRAGNPLLSDPVVLYLEGDESAWDAYTQLLSETLPY